MRRLIDTNVLFATQLGHHLTIERATRIGREVRCSPGSHITSSPQIADRVFLGAGIRSINDKTLTWCDPGGSASTPSSALAPWSPTTSPTGRSPTVTRRACTGKPGDQRRDHDLATTTS